jgi:hypothetical protein
VALLTLGEARASGRVVGLSAIARIDTGRGVVEQRVAWAMRM